MSDLQKLENNEAILLMYLANELNPQDHAEVERMLASDPALRGELEVIRQTQQLAFDALRTLDASTRPGPRIVALSRVSDLIHEWSNGNRETATVTESGQGLPWWRISLSTAAALLVGYYVWAAYHPPAVLPNQMPIPFGSQDAPAEIDGVAIIPPSRDLTPQEKKSILVASLQDSVSDDSPNLRIAETAAAMPSENSDQNATGEP